MKITEVADRAFKALNLQSYNALNLPDIYSLKQIPICNHDEQYILRMLVKTPFGEWRVPSSLMWLRSLLKLSDDAQAAQGINQPYCYITVRHGEVKSVNDDLWHVDGFSMAITHLPEQNYVWTNTNGTEFCLKQIKFPSDFDPMKHNIHYYIQDVLAKAKNVPIYQCAPTKLYCFDPYVIHRRPSDIPEGTIRTFVRIDYSPIMIVDDNNTRNPLLEVPKFNRDGVKEFRDKLIRY